MVGPVGQVPQREGVLVEGALAQDDLKGLDASRELAVLEGPVGVFKQASDPGDLGGLAQALFLALSLFGSGAVPGYLVLAGLDALLAGYVAAGRQALQELVAPGEEGRELQDRHRPLEALDRGVEATSLAVGVTELGGADGAGPVAFLLDLPAQL